MMVFFAAQKLFRFIISHLLINLSSCAMSIMFRMSFPVSMSSSLSPTFSCIRIMVSSLYVSSVYVHFYRSFKIAFFYFYKDLSWNVDGDFTASVDEAA